MNKGNGWEQTTKAVCAFLEALGAERFDLGVVSERGMLPGHQGLTLEQYSEAELEEALIGELE